MKILITGVAGLLGSRLSDWILENKTNVEVIGIDNLSGGYIENIHPDVKFFNIDCKSDELSEIFEEIKPDYVYHFAAYAAEGLSPFIRKYPIDPYGIAKYACEMDIRAAGEQHGLDWCIIRPHNVYGIKQNIWDKYRNVLGIWMYQYMNGEPMTIFGDGEQKRAFSYIDDCLEPLWKSSQQENCSKEIINLGGTKYYTINEANKTLRDVIRDGKVVYKEQRHEVKNAHPTYQKSIDLLDFVDKTPLYDGLSQMWEWAKKQPKRERFVWSDYEINKGIYSFWKK